MAKSMITILPLIISLLPAFVAIIIAIKNRKLKLENADYLIRISQAEELNIDLVNQKANLQNENHSYKAKLEAQQELFAEFERLREESLKTSKSILFNLGNELSKQLIDLHKKETSESRSLSEKHINETSQKFHGEFERLISMVGALNKEINQSRDTVDLIKNSLLSPSSGGRLAEISLENLLKNSGLRSGIDFFLQYKTFGDEGNRLRPDAVILLPADNIMVIDSKTSKFLIDNEKMINTQNDNKLDKLSSLSKIMNLHLKSLTSKDYSEAIMNVLDRKKISSVITVMFVPTEHALEKIDLADPDFIDKAYKNNIIPVGPAGLMSMLSVAKYQITERLIMDNHKLIMEEVKRLISSSASLADHSMRLGNNIKSLVNNYDKFAASFNSNFLKRASSISNLGASSSSKNLPQHLERYHLISNKSEMIEVDAPEEEGAAES